MQRREELAALLGERIAAHSVAEVLERLESAGVPAARVNDVGEVADHEQTAALGLIQSLPEPTVALPLSFEGERLMHRRPPPRLGEHTAEILGELATTVTRSRCSTRPALSRPRADFGHVESNA